MRILLIADELMNNIVNGNNIIQNWLEGMPGIEMAQIATFPGKPYNSLINKYFIITDMMMIKSLAGPRAGHAFEMSFEEMKANPQTQSVKQTSPIYHLMKKISGEPVRLLRELIWSVGRYDEKALKKFVEDFNPDIVLSPRLYCRKASRIESKVAKFTKAPFIAYSGDDELSYRQFTLSPLFWINRFLIRRKFRRHSPLYSRYFTNSDPQSREYAEKYGLKTSTMYKSAEFPDSFPEKEVKSPIRMVYAGNLYCNRWKTLSAIGDALKEINSDGEKMILEIYSPSELTARQRKALSEERSIYFKGKASPADLPEIYRNADIALHVEAFDRKNRLTTRLSFSTKIIDLMASSCAILAIAWEEHAGLQYLKSKDAAICISDIADIKATLSNILQYPALIKQYRLKALATGKGNHDRQTIRRNMLEIFNVVRNENPASS